MGYSNITTASTTSSIYLPTPELERMNYPESELYLTGVKVYFTNQKNVLWQQYKPKVFLFQHGRKRNGSATRTGSAFQHPTHLDGSHHAGDHLYSGVSHNKDGQKIAEVETEWNFSPTIPYEKQSIIIDARTWWKNGLDSTQNLTSLSSIFPADLALWRHKARGMTNRNQLNRATESIKFVVRFAIANPAWTPTNQENRYIFSEPSRPFKIFLVQKGGEFIAFNLNFAY